MKNVRVYHYGRQRITSSSINMKFDRSQTICDWDIKFALYTDYNDYRLVFTVLAST